MAGANRTRIDVLSDAEKAQMDGWADDWIEVGLRTGPADRGLFERSVAECYGFAGLGSPRVVWVGSPLVVALAGPAASVVSSVLRGGAVDGAVNDAVRVAVGGAVDGAVDVAVTGAVDDAVGGAVRVAVDGAVDGAVAGAVTDAVGVAVAGAVTGAVNGAVDGAVNDAVRVAVDVAVDGAVADAVTEITKQLPPSKIRSAIRTHWHRYIGGQFRVGGWYWGGAYTSYFREICGLQLKDNLWDRAKAYEGTMRSACWWWPHQDYVIVSERPTVIHRELTNPDVSRGWGSHRLHCDTGPAIAWPDGFSVWMIHGVPVTEQIVMRPETLTVEQILSEQNVEVRRVMIERFGYDRLLEDADAELVDADMDELGQPRELRRINVPADDEPIVLVRVVNSTREPDGSFREYLLRVPPDHESCVSAVAWTFGIEPSEYQLAEQT